MFGVIAQAVRAGVPIPPLTPVRLMTPLLARHKTANGAEILTAQPVGVHLMQITPALPMILPVAPAKAENGAHLNMVAAGAQHLHLPAQSTTKPHAHPKAAIGALHQAAAVAGALQAPRKNVRPIMKPTAKRRAKLGVCLRVLPPPVVGALTLALIPSLPKPMPKQPALIPEINGV